MLSADQADHLIQALMTILPFILAMALVKLGVAIVLPKEKNRG